MPSTVQWNWYFGSPSLYANKTRMRRLLSDRVRMEALRARWLNSLNGASISCLVPVHGPCNIVVTSSTTDRTRAGLTVVLCTRRIFNMYGNDLCDNYRPQLPKIQWLASFWVRAVPTRHWDFGIDTQTAQDPTVWVTYTSLMGNPDASARCCDTSTRVRRQTQSFHIPYGRDCHRD